MIDSYEIKIYNVGNGNFVQGTYINTRYIHFCIDAGSLSKLDDCKSHAPTTDIFFLTHWHLDHFSFFTLKNSYFDTIIYYLPRGFHFSKNLRGRIERLFAKKAEHYSRSNNLAISGASQGKCPGNAGFLRFHINEHASTTSANDTSVTYYIAHGPSEGKSIEISHNKGLDAFVIPANRKWRFAPVAVFPGDAKERNIKYLTMYCIPRALQVPVYLVSHHGSKTNIDRGMHASHPFGSETRYIVSTERHGIGTSSPYTLAIEPATKSRHFYFTNVLAFWDCCVVTIK